MDEAVISTNDDATLCKRHAVSLGYWRDPFIQLLSKQGTKKPPEISRGYYARVFAVRGLVESYLKINKQQCQIVSIGAGFDTLYWNLRLKEIAPLHFAEIDFPAVTRQKTHAIHAKKDKLLSELGEDIESIGNKIGVISSCYSLLPVDLKDTNNIDSHLRKTTIDFCKPTLILAECVLMYMASQDVDKLLTYFSMAFSNATFLNYDVVNMNDRFAEVMLCNLGSRLCTLHVNDCQSKETQIKRFQRCGYGSCMVSDMNEVYNSIPKKETQRIESIEMLDEVHLLQDMMSHYCICVASNTGLLSISLEDISKFPAI